MNQFRNRIITQIVIPTIVIYIAIVCTGLFYMNRSFERQIIDQKTNDIEKISMGVNNWMVARISEVMQLSRIPLLTEGYQKEKILYYLKEWESRLSHIYHELCYITMDGEYFSTNDSTALLYRTYLFQKFKGESRYYYYFGLIPSSNDLNDNIVIAVPLFDGDGIRGILAATIQIQTLERILNFFTYKEFDQFMLVNPKSVIIVHSDNSLIGEKEKKIYDKEFSINQKYFDDMVFTNVLRTSWKLVCFINKPLMMEQVYGINQMVIASFVVFILIISIFSFVITSHVAYPVKQLTHGIQRIMEGDYLQKINLNTKDELQDLADSFNRLTNRMIERRTDDRFVFIGHLAARMAHEMRKPLHIIKLSSQCMITKKSYDSNRLKLIQSEVQNADNFINEILNFAKPGCLNLMRYSIAKLLAKVVKKYQMFTEEKGIEIVYENDSNIPLFYFDVIKIEQVLSNLLQNAFESVCDMPESAVKKVMILLQYIDSAQIVLSVTDSGSGFDEKEKDIFFEPYFTTKENGTGLGLSICYRIIMAHGGKITLENTPDHHASVQVIFPL